MVGANGEVGHNNYRSNEVPSNGPPVSLAAYLHPTPSGEENDKTTGEKTFGAQPVAAVRTNSSSALQRGRQLPSLSAASTPSLVWSRTSLQAGPVHKTRS